MANLTHRAERALLGALLRDPDLADDARFVTAADFAAPRHQEIFTAIIVACADRRNGTRPHSDFAVSVATTSPWLNPGQLQELAASCARPENAPAYARMVLEASLRRALAAHADRLFRDAGSLHHEITRFTTAAGPRHAAGAVPAHLLKLAHTMLMHAQEFEPGPDNPATPCVPPEGSPVSAVAASAAGGQDKQTRQEEEVLAGLIQHYWQNSHVLDWLPVGAFTPGPRREVYQAIVTLGRNEDPVDELTVDWQLARNRATAQATSPNPARPGQPSPDPGYVTHLAALAVTDGAATMTGRLLLNHHADTELRAGPQSPMPGTAGPRSEALPGAYLPAPNGSHRDGRAVITVTESARPASFGIRSPRGDGPPVPQPPPDQGRPPGQPGPEPRP